MSGRTTMTAAATETATAATANWTGVTGRKLPLSVRRVTTPSRCERSWHARGGHPEAGFTLVELGVAMMIAGILFAMVVAGMIHVVEPTVQTEAIRDSASAVDLVFMTLDGEVRYASVIGPPHQTGTAPDISSYVEFQSSWAATATNPPSCTEVEFTPAGQLEQRTWPESPVPAAPGPSWKTIATGFIADPADPSANPFVLDWQANRKQQLTVTLFDASGTGQGYEVSSSQVTFTALDSVDNTAPGSDPCLTPWS
jgi:type II secretory pathway pseudopilin PulG